MDGVSVARTFICSEHATIRVSLKQLELFRVCLDVFIYLLGFVGISGA